jgi:hypothetical protein
MTWKELAEAIDKIPVRERDRQVIILDTYSGVLMSLTDAVRTEAPLAKDAGFTSQPSDPPREVVPAGGYYMRAG